MRAALVCAVLVGTNYVMAFCNLLPHVTKLSARTPASTLRMCSSQDALRQAETSLQKCVDIVEKYACELEGEQMEALKAHHIKVLNILQTAASSKEASSYQVLTTISEGLQLAEIVLAAFDARLGSQQEEIADLRTAVEALHKQTLQLTELLDFTGDELVSRDVDRGLLLLRELAT
jgi:hypothetical protein